MASVISPFAGLALNPGVAKAIWGVYVALALIRAVLATLLHVSASKILDKLEG